LPAHFPFSSAGRVVAVSALAALALAACGRIGPLEPPPEASAQAKPAMPKPNEVSGETLNPQMKPKIPPITAPDRPFFLDFLLK
jgi:predicted small lipoprotein YifL